MIIFDLDGTLADCEHRRHFVKEPEKWKYERSGDSINRSMTEEWEAWKPNWPAFYEACDKDSVISPTMRLFDFIGMKGQSHKLQIWSGRCESVRQKTESWLQGYSFAYAIHKFDIILKMRPIGDNTPDDILKESWLNERCADLITAQIEGRNPSRHDIEFVFDDRKKVIEMWRRRGIFVFDVSQGKGDF